MIVPPTSDPRWLDLVVEKFQVSLDFLATKILLTRISALAKEDPKTIQSGIEELRTLFNKNIQSPKIQHDLIKIFGSRYYMAPAIYDVEEIAEGLAEGRFFLLAGSEANLNKVPAGNWIGGTTPVTESESKDLLGYNRVFATELPAFIVDIDIKVYEDAESLHNIYSEAPQNGYSIIIIPASSSMHLSFALNAPTYPAFATRPLVGWISGVATAALDMASPKVFNGKFAKAYTNAAVVMRVSLPPNKFAEVEVVNIFKPGSGDSIRVEEDGFEHQYVLINGIKMLFADYIQDSWKDRRLPLVANYLGVMINSSFQKINLETGGARFYAPLFKGIEYRIANTIKDYEYEFFKRLPSGKENFSIFSCNCYLNHLLFSDLGLKIPAALLGPTTFGEIAYQLLNQTIVYVMISDLH